MPVTWSADNKKVVFNCSTTKDLYVYGATITYKDDDAGKLSLNEVSDPTITLNSTTTTEKLLFTINQTAKTQTGTSLETYYTTDGSNPNDTENKSRVKLTQNPQTVTIDWVKGNTVTVRTFTKRVDDSDAKNYRESAEAWQKFTNTGSTDLASVDAPVITPGGEAVVASSLKVTISDKQWKEGNNLKVYYAIEEGSYGNITTSDWTEATSLPQELTLIKTSTVKAYAKYTASDGTETSSDIVSCTYFLLDDATTYLNTATSQNVGTTVGRNGMTMTFGGIKVGSSNFKALSKNENTDANTLGSTHTVSGKALYGTMTWSRNSATATSAKTISTVLNISTAMLQPRNSTRTLSHCRQWAASSSLSQKPTENSQYSWSSRELSITSAESYTLRRLESARYTSSTRQARAYLPIMPTHHQR